MRFSYRILPLSLAGLLAACSAGGRLPQGPPPPADGTEYYVAGDPLPVGRKRLLPDPINGLGHANDPSIRVTDIRQTNSYTVLYMTFTDQQRYGTISGGTAISIQPDARLVTPGGQSFRLLKAEGIPLGPQSMEVRDAQPVPFRLYFERLPPDVTDFAMYECADEPGRTCWNVTGMRLSPDEVR